MSKQSEGRSRRGGEPVDVVDGIPDRSRRQAWWKYVALLVVFLGWVALLVYIQIAGRLKP